MVKIWFEEKTVTQISSLRYQRFFQHIIFIPEDTFMNQCKK